MKLMKLQIHNLNDVGNGEMFRVPVVHKDLQPGIYYWKDNQENVFKALLIISNWVVGIKQ